jgi:hypothetical protein
MNQASRCCAHVPKAVANDKTTAMLMVYAETDNVAWWRCGGSCSLKTSVDGVAPLRAVRRTLNGGYALYSLVGISGARSRTQQSPAHV